MRPQPRFASGDGIRTVVTDWVAYLRTERIWGLDDPLFPATKVAVGDNHRFGAVGLDRKHWSNAARIRTIFKEAFAAAGLPTPTRLSNEVMSAIVTYRRDECSHRHLRGIC